MASSPSPSLRVEEIGTGDQTNTWGVGLDQAIGMLDASIAGLATVALTGNYALTSRNYVADEARNAIIKLTGVAPWAVTIPSVTKLYVFWNASSAVQTVTTGSGTTVTLQVGEVALLICDAANVARVVPTVLGAGPFSMAGALDMGAHKITSVTDPTGAQDAATKAYADALAFTANAGILPGQGGNAGNFLGTNATVASWQALSTANLTDWSAQFAKNVALAVAL